MESIHTDFNDAESRRQAHSDGMKRGRKEALKERLTHEFKETLHKAKECVIRAEEIIEQDISGFKSKELNLVYTKLIECGEMFEMEVKSF